MPLEGRARDICMTGLLHVGLMQGSGACLDQMTSTASVSWRQTNIDCDDDDFRVRLLNKAVQLCYVSKCMLQLLFKSP